MITTQQRQKHIIIIIIITNEKIKVMLSRKRCRVTLQDYNKGEISKCQSKRWTNRNVLYSTAAATAAEFLCHNFTNRVGVRPIDSTVQARVHEL